MLDEGAVGLAWAAGLNLEGRITVCHGHCHDNRGCSSWAGKHGPSVYRDSAGMREPGGGLPYATVLPYASGLHLHLQQIRC